MGWHGSFRGLWHGYAFEVEVPLMGSKIKSFIAFPLLPQKIVQLRIYTLHSYLQDLEPRNLQI